MRKLPNDPIMNALRERYPKNGPDPRPGEDVHDWADRYLDLIRGKITAVNRLNEQKMPINDICKAVGMRKEVVEYLSPHSKKTETQISK